MEALLSALAALMLCAGTGDGSEPHTRRLNISLSVSFENDIFLTKFISMFCIAESMIYVGILVEDLPLLGSDDWK